MKSGVFQLHRHFQPRTLLFLLAESRISHPLRRACTSLCVNSWAIIRVNPIHVFSDLHEYSGKGQNNKAKDSSDSAFREKRVSGYNTRSVAFFCVWLASCIVGDQRHGKLVSVSTTVSAGTLPTSCRDQTRYERTIALPHCLVKPNNSHHLFCGS